MKDEHGNEIVIDNTTEAAPSSSAETSENQKISLKNRLRLLLRRFWAKKKLAIPVIVLVLIALLFAIPFTRYPLAGLFLKQNFKVSVIDSVTNKPVSSATVSLRGQTAITDSNGLATIKVKVGKASAKVEKKYYESHSAAVTVPLFEAKNSFQIKLTATGRQVPVSVRNFISGKPIENVLIKVLDTESKTDENGEAIVVIPATDIWQNATFSGEGFNELSRTIKPIEEKVAENSVALTPQGKIYFLSKLSGKIDVVKTDLDGKNRQIVLPGTGQEDETGTVMLAARDWKYLALLSRREGAKAKLYLIETSTDKLTVMDEGEASFGLTGWVNHHFAYTVSRHNVKDWEPKQSALKTYDADNKKIILIDETQAMGDSSSYANDSILWVYNIGNELIYYKSWSAYHASASSTFPELGVKQDQIISAVADASNKKTLASYDARTDPGFVSYSFRPNGSYQSSLYEPDEIFFVLNREQTTYHKVADGKVTEDAEAKTYFEQGKAYATYLASPSGQETFWSEARDGKNTLLIGDQTGHEPKQIASLSELTPYGWYTDDYLLLSKNGSELYIMSREAEASQIKISDYHKPALSYLGYGGGYGGL